MPDPIAPLVAGRPAEAVELVSLAVSDGDLEAALAQYEAGAVLRPWARDPDGNTDGLADALTRLIDLRLPLSVRICAVLPADELSLVLAERQIAGAGPDREPVQLDGQAPQSSGAARRQLGHRRLCLAPEHTRRSPATRLILARSRCLHAGTGS